MSQVELDLDDLLVKNEPIYVLNASKPKGTIICTFSDSSGKRAKPLMIPKTWIPIKVSGPIPKPLIGESLDFREHLHKGILKLVPHKEAERIMTESDARKELARLSQSHFSHDPKFASQAAKDMLDAYNAQDEMVDATADIKLERDDDVLMDINPLVLAVTKRYNMKDLDANSTLNEFRCMEEDLTQKDIDYIVGNCDDKVREWGRKKLENFAS